MKHIKDVHCKAHQCPDCGKSFNHKYNLDIHIKMVHVKNKTLSCDVCGKMFFIPSKLEHHRRTVHEKLKPFQCEFCGFRLVPQKSSIRIASEGS